MARLIDPLSIQVPIVDKDGKPSPQFMRVLSKLSLGSSLTKDSNGNVTLADKSVTFAKMADLANAMIIARKTAGAGTPEACTISDILNFVTTTQGSILYRGATGWQALAPGTAGKVLQTNGAGADPSWASAAAGVEAPMTQPTTTGFTQVNFAAGTALANTAHGVLLSDTTGGTNIRAAVVTPDPTNFTLTMRLHRLNPLSGAGYQACTILRNSTNGRICLHGEYNNIQDLIQNWTNITTFNGNVIAARNLEIASFPWRRVQRIGNTLNWYYSADGENWGMLAMNGSVVGFLTATGGGNIDQVGFGIMASSGSATNIMGTVCTSFVLTTP